MQSLSSDDERKQTAKIQKFFILKKFLYPRGCKDFLICFKKRGTDNKGRISNSRYLGSVTIS